MSTDLEEVSPETGHDKKIRVHVLVYEKDWQRLELLYGSAVKRGSVIRMLLRDFLKRLDAKAEQKL